MPTHLYLNTLLVLAYEVIHHVCPTRTLCHLVSLHERLSVTRLDQRDQTPSFKFLSQIQTSQALSSLIFL